MQCVRLTLIKYEWTYVGLLSLSGPNTILQHPPACIDIHIRPRCQEQTSRSPYFVRSQHLWLWPVPAECVVVNWKTVQLHRGTPPFHGDWSGTCGSRQPKATTSNGGESVLQPRLAQNHLLNQVRSAIQLDIHSIVEKSAEPAEITVF